MRRRARVLSFMLLTHAVLSLVLWFAFDAGFIASPSLGEGLTTILGVNFTLTILLYGLSRRGFFYEAAHLSAAINIIAIFYGMSISYNEPTVFAGLPWLLEAIFLISFVGSSFYMIATAILGCTLFSIWLASFADLSVQIGYFYTGLPVLTMSLLIMLRSLVQGRDFHDWEQARKHAKTRQQLLQAVMDHTSAMVYAKALHGDDFFVNNQMKNMLSSDSSKSYEQGAAELFAWKHAATDDPTSSQSFERIIKINAADYIYLIHRFPLYGEDSLVFAVAYMAIDITTQRKAENKLKEQQERLLASAKLSAIGQMAAEIAHEINNPLSIIQISARHIKKYLTEPQPRFAEAVTAAEVIGQTVVRISKIVQGLKSVSRSDQGGTFQREKLQDVLDDALGICEERFRSRGVTLFRPEAITAMELTCNRVQISQIILNLLNNAYDAAHDGERPWVRVAIRELESSISIAISDSGPGVPRELRDKIFHPFFTTKDTSQGTGLGLAVSASIVSGHRGKLHLDETSPHTCFVLNLPKDAFHQQAADQVVGA